MKRGDCTIEKSKIAQEILTYLAENPGAEDTLTGIAEWWLLEQQITSQTAKIKEALAELVTKGLILERKGKDSRTHYRVNQRKSGEILSMLKKKHE